MNLFLLGFALLGCGGCERPSALQRAYAQLESSRPEEACALLEQLVVGGESESVTPECAVAALLIVEAKRQRDEATVFEAAALERSLEMLPRLVCSGEYREDIQTFKLLSERVRPLQRLNPVLASAYLEGAASVMDGEGCLQRVARALFLCERAQMVLDLQEDNAKAELWFEECLSLSKSCEAAHLPFTCRAYSGLAKIAQMRRNLDESEAYLRKAIDAAEKVEERRTLYLAQTNTNLGAVLLEKKKVNEAYEQFMIGMDLMGEDAPPVLLVDALHGLAWVTLYREEYIRSIAYNQRALAVVCQGDLPLETKAKICYELGIAFTETGRTSEAREQFSAALNAVHGLDPTSPGKLMISDIEKRLVATSIE